jgi:hypothetical protein
MPEKTRSGLTSGACGLPPACARPPRLSIHGPASGMSAARLEKVESECDAVVVG